MSGILIDASNIVRYYGSPAGYVRNSTVTADPLFRTEELEDFFVQRGLSVRWVEGLYERLAQGGDIASQPPKSCRVWQLKPQADPELKFAPYHRVAERWGGPRREDYSAVYDGPVEDADPEAVWERFRFCDVGEGHPLSISDIIELYDEDGGEYFYIDRTRLLPIDF